MRAVASVRGLSKIYRKPGANVEVARPEGEIPHYLPGQNPFVNEHAAKNRLPLAATLGGPETMYPEFMATLKTLPNATMPAPATAAPAPGGRGARPPQGGAGGTR